MVRTCARRSAAHGAEALVSIATVSTAIWYSKYSRIKHGHGKSSHSKYGGPRRRGLLLKADPHEGVTRSQPSQQRAERLLLGGRTGRQHGEAYLLGC